MQAFKDQFKKGKTSLKKYGRRQAEKVGTVGAVAGIVLILHPLSILYLSSSEPCLCCILTHRFAPRPHFPTLVRAGPAGEPSSELIKFLHCPNPNTSLTRLPPFAILPRRNLERTHPAATPKWTRR